MKNSKLFANIKFLLKIFFKYGKKLFALSLIKGIFASTIVVYVEVNTSKLVIDGLIRGNPFRDIILIISVFTLIHIINIALQQILDVGYTEKATLKINANINKDIFNKIMHTDYKYLDDPNFYDNYQWTVERLADQTRQVAQFLWNNISTIVKIITLISIISTTDPIIIIFSVLSILLTALLYNLIVKVFYAKDTESLSIRRKLGYTERLFYLRDYSLELRTTKLSKIFINNYFKNIDKLIGVIKKFMTKIISINTLRMSITTTFYMITMGYLGFRVSNGNITIGEFSAMLIAFNTLRASLGNISDVLVELKRMGAYTEKIISFMETKSEIEDDTSENKVIVGSEPFHIKIENAYFRYNENSKYILNNLSLEIKPNQKIAIVGENGVGKTTLVKLLLRLYDLNGGSIYINGDSLKQLDLQSVRKNIGTAFQQSKIYATDVRNNLRIYNDDDGNDDEKINNALKILHLDDVLAKSNHSLDTEMTKEFDANGIEFSGGQAQLLAITRLFVKDFGLLIMDEPSSALDPLMEYELNKVIMNEINNATVIIISHRLSTVRDADNIFLISDGKVAESGTHEQLMKMNGIYCNMFNKQAENYIKQ